MTSLRGLVNVKIRGRLDGGRKPYHHGDLRRVLLAAAVEAIAERGAAALSLRDLARRAGVSHAAPTHHFRDKAGLLTAVAVEGFARLGAALSEARDFADAGVAYVRFAMTQPGYFAVMFRPVLYHRDDPEVAAARARTTEMLRGARARRSATTTGCPRSRPGPSCTAWPR